MTEVLQANGEVSYAELRCLSNFSFLKGASHPHELVARAKELGYEALAITDECSLAGVARARCRQRGRAKAAHWLAVQG
jgi:error-prone DNA polymerase